MEKHYIATIKYRLQDISKIETIREILNKWKQYQEPLGHKLVRTLFQFIK